nr:metalloregulator ArsR/SmtB family transcription factor [Limibaculum sp. NKW23]
MTRAFAALGSVPRLMILRILVRAGEGGLAVGALGERLGITGSTLSHHIAALVRAGLIEQIRHGRSLICRARFDEVRDLADYLISECCRDEAGGAACAHGAPAAAATRD